MGLSGSTSARMRRLGGRGSERAGYPHRRSSNLSLPLLRNSAIRT
jgi:hypothetical protein